MQVWQSDCLETIGGNTASMYQENAELPIYNHQDLLKQAWYGRRKLGLRISYNIRLLKGLALKNCCNSII
jgi:hypothetical protein